MEKKEQIILSSTHKNTIANELEITVATVRIALKGYSHSELTSKIRARAKELLEAEASKITI